MENPRGILPQCRIVASDYVGRDRAYVGTSDPATNFQICRRNSSFAALGSRSLSKLAQTIKTYTRGTTKLSSLVPRQLQISKHALLLCNHPINVQDVLRRKDNLCLPNVDVRQQVVGDEMVHLRRRARQVRLGQTRGLLYRPIHELSSTGQVLCSLFDRIQREVSAPAVPS